ncbi:hypothetical protein chiPu_0024076 [Chiloscyllium punctatum]|uniref:Uncharacterized protein n=1 Tax=Chiloscyllium punctatum TaxID=137246 RepID=A0A401TCT9_CHIPU|nr:hypothetical protein [Chiloscyllium punctatum]
MARVGEARRQAPTNRQSHCCILIADDVWGRLLRRVGRARRRAQPISVGGPAALLRRRIRDGEIGATAGSGVRFHQSAGSYPHIASAGREGETKYGEK